MMKMRRMMTLLGVGVVTLMNVSTVVYAQEVTESGNQFGTSEAQIEFKAATDVPDIINPDPDNPSEPDDSSGTDTGNSGPLTLDYAPKVNFGIEKISATTKEYSAIMSGHSPFVQVTDRRGNGAGWQLNASFSGFYEVTTEEEGTETVTNMPSLPGATISFLEGSAITNGTIEDNEPEVEDSISLSQEATADTFMKAPENKGMGSWALIWKDTIASETTDKNESIKLTIPGGTATAGKHKATISWTLSDVPSAEETPTE